METTDWFGEEIAATYDEDSADLFRPEVLYPQLEVLAELAAGGPVLEFAIGTGRVGLPLGQRGLRVTGIELSTAMVARLRSKPAATRPRSLWSSATWRPRRHLVPARSASSTSSTTHS